MLRFQAAVAHTALTAMMGTGAPDVTAQASSQGAGPPEETLTPAAPANANQTLGCKAAVNPPRARREDCETTTKTTSRTLLTKAGGQSLTEPSMLSAVVFRPPLEPCAPAAHERKWRRKNNSATEVLVRVGPLVSTRVYRGGVNGMGLARDLAPDPGRAWKESAKRGAGPPPPTEPDRPNQGDEPRADGSVGGTPGARP